MESHLPSEESPIVGAQRLRDAAMIMAWAASNLPLEQATVARARDTADALQTVRLALSLSIR